MVRIFRDKVTAARDHSAAKSYDGIQEYRREIKLRTKIIYHDGHLLDSSSCEEQVFARQLESSALPNENNEVEFSLSSSCFQVIFPQEKPMKKR